MTDAPPPLATRIGPLLLRNPILTASGTYGSGIEAMDSVDLSEVGGVVTKSVTTQPRIGNAPHRIHETASGMLNSIGLMNPGVERFLAEVMPRFRALPCARIINVAGESLEDFEALVRIFDREDAVDAIEINVSCPNVAGGLDYGADPDLLERLVSRCRAATEKPLIVKLTPNVTDVTRTALAAERGGGTAISLVNTYQGMAVDWRRRRPVLGSATGAGGLSGPAIKPLALFAVHRVRGAVRVPIIGIGGIMDAEDVMEFVVAGASAVQVGTANFLDPARPAKIAARLGSLLDEAHCTDLPSLIGTLRVGSDPPVS